jgi:ribosome-binding ATPase YchF (GTP1/OBG family)
MDEVTQRSAATAEESASASEQLNAQSQALMAVVAQLQEMVGASQSAVARVPSKVAIRKPAALHKASLAPAKPALIAAGVTPRTKADFPLDDSEFKEF